MKLHGVAAQITLLVAVSALLGIVLTSIVLFVLFGDWRKGQTAPALRTDGAIRLAHASRDPAKLDAIIAAAQRAGMPVGRLALTEVGASLPHSRTSSALGGSEVLAQPESRIAVRMDDRTALFFVPNAVLLRWRFLLASLALTATIVVVMVWVLSAYAARCIVAPLSSIAEAAHAFGQSSDDDRILTGTGRPREIVQVVDALNDMRTRVRTRLEGRTRMLAAISHDLRTPLTRLRLRAERADATDRAGMLYEIVRINRMLEETLEYLRHDLQSEGMVEADLPSLLQTVCAEFSDIGHAVVYDGPVRSIWRCRPSALARAVTNLVDNATKHSTSVSVSLRVRDENIVEVEVSDDGPGIPACLREKVLEPFYRVDRARTRLECDGFGLGLSIAYDIVRHHGGNMRLLERVPHGLVVRISLPR